MNASDNKVFFLSSSPHFTKGISTQLIMLTVLISTLPECVYGVMLYGVRALVTILVSVASAVAFEALFQLVTKRKVRVYDLSAAVTGVLLALVLPSTVPVWMTALGAAVAVVVAKGLFGGLGQNTFNPALIGRGFLVISFAGAMGASWFNPDAAVNKWSYALTGAQNADVISSATVLRSVKAGSFVASPDSLWQLFVGHQAGCIGETSALLILISFAFLLICRVIDFRAPLAMVLTVSLCTFISSLVETHSASQAGLDVLVALCTGGLLFGATFMVTDYATTPVTKPGRIVFGAGCGLITFLIRRFGGYPEGVMFSILIMNAVTPFLNRLTVRKYGYGKKALKKAEPKKIVQDFNIKDAKTEESK